MTAASSADAARRATELYQLGFARAAIDVLEIALKNDPLSGALWRLRAVLLAREGRNEEAFADVQEAMTLTPLRHEELLILAAGYARRGHKASAMDTYSELAADPAFPTDHWELLYNGFCTVGRWHSALMWLRRVARHRCDDDQVYFAMAQWGVLADRRS
jgi:Tfp pilus assembly protein PilF